MSQTDNTKTLLYSVNKASLKSKQGLFSKPGNPIYKPFTFHSNIQLCYSGLANYYGIRSELSP